MLKPRVRLIVYATLLLLLGTILLNLRKKNHSPRRILTLDVNSNIKKIEQKEQNSTANNGLNAHNDTEHLPSAVIKGVKRFVFFIGYARSGHSIVASLLDAHPHIAIAHEYSMFSKWIKEPRQHSDKEWLFSTLFFNSKHSSETGLRNKQSKKKGYSLGIPDWWQGKYKERLEVIGDKAGGMTAQIYRKNHTAFLSTYDDLKKTLAGTPISVIHVLRNPYDNIAAMLLYNVHMKQSVNATHKYVNDQELTKHINSYFKQVKSVYELIRKTSLNVIEIHNLNMIFNPKGTMRSICSHLKVECSERYLHMCAKSTYSITSRSRELVQWTDDNIQLVFNKIQAFISLKRYDFLN